MKKKILYLCVIMAFIISGCGRQPDYADETENILDSFVLEDHTIYLMNKYDDTVCLYDLEREKLVKKYLEKDFMFYGFGNDSEYYTAGHSFENHFCILKVADENLEVVYQMKEQEGIFPLAQNQEHMLFLREVYDDENNVTQQEIVQFDMENKTLTTLWVATVNVAYGAIVQDALYFSSYVEEKDSFDLYCVDLGEETFEITKQMELNEGILYSDGKELYWQDNNELCSNSKSVKKGNVNYFVNEDVVIELYIAEEELCADVVRIPSGEVLLSEKEFVSFEIQPGELILYCDGSVTRMPLSE